MKQKQTSTVRVIAMGLAAIVLQVVLSCYAIQYTHPSNVLLVFGLGLPLGWFVAKSRGFLLIIACALFALTPVIPAVVIQAPMFGPIAEVDGEQGLPDARSATGFRLKGWRIATEYECAERLVRSRKFIPYGTRKIAPLVPEEWSPTETVHVWVVAEEFDSGQPVPWSFAQYSSGHNEYVRRVGHQLPSSQGTANRAAKIHALRSADDSMIVLPVASAQELMRQEAFQSGLVLAVACILWFFSVIFWQYAQCISKPSH